MRGETPAQSGPFSSHHTARGSDIPASYNRRYTAPATMRGRVRPQLLRSVERRTAANLAGLCATNGRHKASPMIPGLVTLMAAWGIDQRPRQRGGA